MTPNTSLQPKLDGPAAGFDPVPSRISESDSLPLLKGEAGAVVAQAAH
jgi:hypothetical protein